MELNISLIESRFISLVLITLLRDSHACGSGILGDLRGEKYDVELLHFQSTFIILAAKRVSQS